MIARSLPPGFETATARETITREVGYPYLIAFPEGYERSGARKWPLLVFLHGAGERGNDLDRLLKHGPPKLIAEGRKFDAIVVCPQVPPGEIWTPAGVMAVVNQVKKQCRVDPSREYITGISMGGFGTWSTIIEYPEEFAAAVIIVGSAGIEILRFGDRPLPPVRAFHGDADPVIPVSFSQMTDYAARKAKIDEILETYPGVDHDSWTQTYENPEVWEWLFAQERPKS